MAESRPMEVRSLCLRRPYLARFNTTSPRPSPADAVGTVYFNSSPTIVNGRVCWVPVQFGYELYSMFNVRVCSASLIVYLPNWEMLPCTAALFSSGVPVVRLLDANLGTPVRPVSDI